MQAASQNLVPVTLELGGKSPVVIGRSAKLDLAGTRLTFGKLLNGGQLCLSPDYVLVPEDMEEQLVARLVDEALSSLPAELLPVLDNVAVQVLDRDEDEPGLLGLYEGVPHTERTGSEGPDVVSVFRLPLCEMCDDLDDLRDEVRVTVIHELAHAAGIDDERLDELGWA
ncbi:MAG: aldehyde dehydrogenase family protein [Actinobacteria bacterium]|nr:aldehyde dehydrogenase family protein [Actinomycetota bacterium]